MTYSSTDLIAAVKQSPALVAVHDRARWCGLYAADGQVNDPVGSRPHQGRAAIERFYDTFIAPNTIVFHVEQDIVCGMSVMRDLNIQTTMSTGVTLSVPMHLRYDLAEEGGVLKIRRLYAHWELPFMISQLLKTGLKGIWTSIKLGPQLIANQGFG
ncbi:MAG: ketosteroid isomerase family protein, partial [Nevskiales bacterium]